MRKMYLNKKKKRKIILHLKDKLKWKNTQILLVSNNAFLVVSFIYLAQASVFSFCSLCVVMVFLYNFRITRSVNRFCLKRNCDIVKGQSDHIVIESESV